MSEYAGSSEQLGDLISRSALMEFPIRIDHYDKENGDEHFVLGIESVLEYADNLPTVNAAEIRRGYWHRVSEMPKTIKYRCSLCGRTVWGSKQLSAVYEKYPYCHCGAKMECTGA